MKQILSPFVDKNQNNLLASRIKELQSALFFSVSNTVLKIPTHVVSGAEVDEQGQIWFVIPKPSQQISEFDSKFRAKLDFFKKGKDFFLKIEGNASIVSDPAEMNSYVALSPQITQQVKEGRVVVIKVEVIHEQYFATAVKPAQTSLVENALQMLNKWFTTPEPTVRQSRMKRIPIPLPVSNSHSNKPY